MYAPALYRKDKGKIPIQLNVWYGYRGELTTGCYPLVGNKQVNGGIKSIRQDDKLYPDKLHTLDQITIKEPSEATNPSI